MGGRSGWLVLTLCAAVATGSARSEADPDRALRRWAAAAGQQVNVLRIGLEPAKTVRIESGARFRVLDPATGRTIWRDGFDAELRVVADGGPQGEVPRVFRIQVAAFGSESAAQAELRRLEAALGVTGVVHADPDRGNWRVRLGRAEDRLALTPLTERLRARGLKDTWIAEEPAGEVEKVSLRLVDESYVSHASGLTRLAVVPAKGARIEVDGKSYRGLIEIRVTRFGQVRAVNWVALEKYLLGVVPAELGPEVWPEVEALKAQAVAARTYVWRNRNQFVEDGFDLCSTPRCQVYKGYEAEHPLSDRAVGATRNEILSFEDRPIIALYTATCGGHTEDGKNVFSDHDEPYLRGVPCRAENDALATLRATLKGEAIEPLVDETGAEVTRDAALLARCGVLEGSELQRESMLAPLAPQELRRYTQRLAQLAGLPAPQGPAGGTETLAAASGALVADLGWDRRARLLLSEQDLPALVRDAGGEKLLDAQHRAVAYLAWVEGLQPFGDGSYHLDERPSRARLLPALARIGERYKAFGLRKGVVSAVGRDSVRLVRGKGEVRLPLAGRPYLFGRGGGKPVPAEALELWPGDRIRYRTNAAGAIEFLELTPPIKGVSDDRSAAVYSWEVRRTRRQLEALINQRVSIGRLKKLQVKARGVSGRVSELEVVGDRGTSVIRGFDVRRLLDLRESLTVIEVQRDSKGAINAVVFAGKGWGHGVGMCQVGAYGMALRGSAYREILAHYYQGATITRIRP